MPKSRSTASIKLEADGVDIHAWAETDGDVHLKIDSNEDVILSPSTASIIGMALLQLATPEE